MGPHRLAVVDYLLSGGILMCNKSRGKIPKDEHLVTLPVDMGTAATVYKVFDQPVVLKFSDRSHLLVNPFSGYEYRLMIGAWRMRFTKTQLEALATAGLRTAKLIFADDNLMVQSLIDGIRYYGLFRSGMDVSVIREALKSYSTYLSAAKAAGIDIDSPSRNLIFEISTRQWVAVDA
ncbi:MAG: hypothetical protein Q7T03_05930 [Deltaproteobacteria bacterium]|nr:hypothetical protein [Deltaproteobacteria bacterium]